MKLQEFDEKNMFFTTLSHFTSGFSSSAHFEDAVLLQKSTKSVQKLIIYC